MRSPNCWYAQSRASSAVIASTSGSWSAGVVAKEHLLQRVAAEAAAERLERDDLFRRDVPEVHGGAELLDEPRPGGPRRCLEDDVLAGHGIGDLADELRAHVAGLAVESRPPALSRFGDHLPWAHIKLRRKVPGHVRGAPAELHDVDVVTGGLEHVLPRARAETLVDHVREPTGARCQSEVKAAHRAPRAWPGRAPARRGRASCRASRCRR